MNQNPLLVPVESLIDYPAIEPGHIEPAISQLISAARAAVEHAAAPEREPLWEAIIEPLEAATEKLWRAWAVVGHLNAVINTPALRDAYNACLPKVTEFSTWLGQHTGLYRQYQRLHASSQYAGMSPVRRRIIDLALRDFRLGGVDLQGAQREQYAKNSERRAQMAQKFSENVLDSVDQWSLLVTDETLLAGLPQDVKHAALMAAQKDNAEGWKLTLKMPCYLPVLQYALDRPLRENLYRAYATVASEQGNPEFDNSAIIEDLLSLRSETAALLGYSSFADLRLQTRMANNPKEVLEFLRELARKAKPYAERDLSELRLFAKETLGLHALEPWDLAFVSERLREQRYAYSEEEVKRYFTEPQVLSGLFQVIEKLFGVRLRPSDAKTWHPDAQGLIIETLDGQQLGHLLIDLYSRQGKQGGAWVDSERNRRAIPGHIQRPIVYLTCNFPAPQAASSALLTHDDVITLFHESGHALHALLGEIDEPEASAFTAVEWDAIELPSQFMENFCWEWPVIKILSAHIDSGKPLPRELYDKLLAAKNFQSGMQTVRQIEFALFDMLIHHRNKGLSIQEVLQTLEQVRHEVAVLFPPQWHRFPHNFSHLFGGGYSAGYYSYKWAEVLSADAYAVFEENAPAGPDGTREILDPQIGQRFRREILATGGSRPAADSFHAFRGRAATLDALLRHNGMSKSDL